MYYIKEVIALIISSFTFVYIVSILSFRTTYRNILYYPTPNGENFLGQIGSYVASLSFFIFGKTAYLLIISLFFILFALVFDKKRFFLYAKIFFIVSIIISGFIGLLSEEFQGGLIGGITGILFKTLFGFVGTLIILVILTLMFFSSISEKIYNSILNPKNIFKNLVTNLLNKNKEQDKNKEQKIIEIKEYYLDKEILTPENNNNISSQNYNIPKKEKNIEPTNDLDDSKIEYAPIDYEYGNEIFENYEAYDYHKIEEKMESLYKREEGKIIIDCSRPKDNKEIRKESEETEEYQLKNEKNYENFKEERLEETAKIEKSDIKSSTYDHNYNKPNNSLEQKNEFYFPDISFLKKSPKEFEKDEENEKITIGQKLIEVLKEFNIDATLENIVSGPVITRYEIIPPKGLKLNKIVSLEDNISLGLASHEKIRIEAPVPGKKVVGIEVPNKNRAVITLREMIENPDFKPDSMAIPFALGKDITGKPYYTDIAKIPHLLIAGSTGSGKSVCLNSLITTILYTKKPDELKLILVDPKRVELKLYDGIPHLITPVIKDLPDAISMLSWAVSYMEERYKILETNNVRNIKSYNLINRDKMPYILIIIDEFADLIITGKKEIEDPIIRLAAMARAVGIHLVLATQRPSADIITNLIKANFPGRIAFKVATKLESRIILDLNGAEKLLGKGDMLYASPNSLSIKRLQAPLISDEEVNLITDYYRKNYTPEYWDIIEEDQKEIKDPTDEPLFNEAVQIILKDKKASASYLQRRLKIGYNRAARIIEMMEDMGIISPPYSGKREILIDSWQGN